DNESEAFASAGTAYYGAADAMAEFILHPETPEGMRLVGTAAWCYLRDRVFGGKVFTERGEDPFAGESLDSLLTQVVAGEPRALWRAYWGEDPDVFDPASAGLIDDLLRRNPT
ncbi:MAG TPA: hypothetical protein VFW62_08515, partial [bacterium]|nr:hypothetical protein [bacterium]